MRKGIEFIRKVDEAWVPSVMFGSGGDGWIYSTLPSARTPKNQGGCSSMGFTEASSVLGTR